MRESGPAAPPVNGDKTFAEAELKRLREQALALWPTERRALRAFGLRDGMRILDVGCGPGTITAKLAELYPSSQVVGLESDPMRARIARRQCAGQRNVTIVEGTPSANDLEKASVDFAYARFVLQHMSSPIDELEGLRRLLKPGGQVVAVDTDDGLLAIYPQPPELEQTIRLSKTLQTARGGDRCVGRKLAALMDQAGFTQLTLKAMSLTSSDLGRELFASLAISFRLGRLRERYHDAATPISDAVDRFLSTNDWYGVVSILAARGLRAPADGDASRVFRPALFEPVHTAKTREEHEAVYRLRYDVLVEEFDKGYLPAVDHTKRWVCDSEDVRDDVTLLYTGEPSAMTGSVRVQLWPPGAVPPDVWERFSLDQFPNIESYQIGEVSRLVVSATARRQLILPALALAIFHHALERNGTLIGFAYCAPGLVSVFQKFGFRPYGGDVIVDADGIRLPMVVIASDLSYFRQVGSPLVPLLERYFAGHPADRERAQPILDALDTMTPHYEIDSDHVWRELQTRLLTRPGARPALLEGLDDDEIHHLTENALVMDVPARHTVMREGLVEKELFLILDGTFEGISRGKRFAIMGQGELFGEVSLFHAPGRRQFTVRSLTNGRVLVLREHFIKDLMQQHPAMASRVLFNLASALATRAANMLQCIDTAAR